MNEAVLSIMAPKRGRPKTPGKPEYVTVKIDVKAYGDAKAVANMENRTTAEIVSEAVAKYVKPMLVAHLKKRTADD